MLVTVGRLCPTPRLGEKRSYSVGVTAITEPAWRYNPNDAWTATRRQVRFVVPTLSRKKRDLGWGTLVS